MLSMYRFMTRSSATAELEAIVRYQAIDFPDTGPETATVAQKSALAKAWRMPSPRRRGSVRSSWRPERRQAASSPWRT